MAPRLVDPGTEWHRSFLDAVAEFHAEDRWADVSEADLADAVKFRDHVVSLHELATPYIGRPRGWVPTTVMWWVSEEVFLGRVEIRHRLTPGLRRRGGHIGFDVRPSARRQGHATSMLAAALPVAFALGINPALVSCDKTNGASQRVIERNGGRLAEADGDILRFWLPTTRGVVPP